MSLSYIESLFCFRLVTFLWTLRVYETNEPRIDGYDDLSEKFGPASWTGVSPAWNLKENDSIIFISRFSCEWGGCGIHLQVDVIHRSRSCGNDLVRKRRERERTIRSLYRIVVSNRRSYDFPSISMLKLKSGICLEYVCSSNWSEVVEQDTTTTREMKAFPATVS